MAQKKMPPSEKVKTALVIPLAEAKERISAQIDRGNNLLLDFCSTDYVKKKWDKRG